MSGIRLLDSRTILRRPVTLAPDGTTYVVTWLPVEKDTAEGKQTLTMSVIVARAPDGEVTLMKYGASEAFERDDRVREIPADIGGDLPRAAPPASEDGVFMTAETVNALLDGKRPDLAALFRDLRAMFLHFADFPKIGKASPEDVATFCAVYVVSTYLLDAFPATGYIWLTGLKNSGKSTVAYVIARTACIPLLASASSTLASFRNHADAGGTLALDNYEAVKNKDDTARNLRSFCEIGYQKGAVVTLQVPSATGRGWETARCNVYANRTFTAVAEPPDALASRCAVITMIPTADGAKASIAPMDDDNWTPRPADLRQHLWMVSAHCLRDAATTVRTITSANTRLTNRHLQVWRPALTVARLVDRANGTTDVWDAVVRLAHALIEKRAEDDGSREVYVTRACVALYQGKPTRITATLVMERAHRLAEDDEADTWGLESAEKVGRLLKRMGLEEAQRAGNKRGYILDHATVVRLQAAHLPSTRATPVQVPLDNDGSDGSDSNDSRNVYGEGRGNPVIALPMTEMTHLTSRPQIDSNDGNDGKTEESPPDDASDPPSPYTLSTVTTVQSVTSVTTPKDEAWKWAREWRAGNRSQMPDVVKAYCAFNGLSGTLESDRTAHAILNLRT